MKKMKVWNYESSEDDKLAEQVKKDKDIVMTKPLMAKYIIDKMPLKENDLVMEPCCGTGSFYDAIPDYCKKEWCEINLDKDYLEYDGIVDYTVSNPPFVPRKLFWSFHQKAMNTTKKEIWWLINISSFNVFTPKRLEEMEDNGWFIYGFYIVADKRWFGRYAALRIGKDKSKSCVLGYERKVF